MSPESIRPIIVASNRGPLAFALSESGKLVQTKTGGGLASGLRPLLDGRGQAPDGQSRPKGYWVANPMTDADRVAKSSGLLNPAMGSPPEALTVVMTEASPDLLEAAVNRFATERLWFWHHDLGELVDSGEESRTHPKRAINSDFAAFVAMNRLFADEIAKFGPSNSLLLVQDYHLPFVAKFVAGHRPDIAAVHFSHTPFASPDTFAQMPRQVAAQILQAMAAHRACGFHSQRWADHFTQSCEAFDIGPPKTFVSPLPPDTEQITAMGSSQGVAKSRINISARQSGRKLIVRVDRLEPTKNIVAGFEAFAQLLDNRPELAEKITFLAFAYPSRGGLGIYRRLKEEVQATVARINSRWATPTWQPIELNLDDDLEAAIAGLSEYDVLVVNPLSDGLNLVAFEGPIVNKRNGVVVLSNQAGAHDQLGQHVESIDPLDIEGTAAAIERALESSALVRQRQHEAQVNVATARTIDDWLADQVAAVT